MLYTNNVFDLLSNLATQAGKTGRDGFSNGKIIERKNVRACATICN